MEWAWGKAAPAGRWPTCLLGWHDGCENALLAFRWRTRRGGDNASLETTRARLRDEFFIGLHAIRQGCRWPGVLSLQESSDKFQTPRSAEHPQRACTFPPVGLLFAELMGCPPEELQGRYVCAVCYGRLQAVPVLDLRAEQAEMEGQMARFRTMSARLRQHVSSFPHGSSGTVPFLPYAFSVFVLFARSHEFVRRTGHRA